MTRNHIAAAVGLALMLSSPAISAPPECESFDEIKPGATIVVVRYKGVGKPVRGVFAGSDASGVALQLAQSGDKVVIPWGSVRKIKPKRPRVGFWSGMFVGAAIAAASLMGDDGPGASAGAALVGVGAGVGALAGGFTDRPLCQGPEVESASPTR